MVLALLGPQIVKALSSMAEQKKAAEARRAGKRPESGAAVDLHDREQADRHQSLAEKRRAELEAWRARQVGSTKRAQTQTRVGGTPGTAVVPPAKPARGGDLRAELAERRRAALEEIRRRQDIGVGPEQSTTPPKSSPPRSSRPVRRVTGPSIRGLRPASSTPTRREPAPGDDAVSRQSSPPSAEPLAPALTARRRRSSVIVPSSPNAGFRGMALNQSSIRQAFILKELFSAPVGLRDDLEAPPGLRF